MTKAAGRLHLAEAALSHQLRDIERRFNTPFFLRIGRGVVLTTAGQRVLERARGGFDDRGRTEDELRRLAGSSDGIIRVCTQCNTGYHWLPALMTTFSRKHPRVDVSIVVDATDNPVSALLEGRIDLAIL